MSTLRAALAALVVLTLVGYASLMPGDPPRVDVVGVVPLQGQGMELRMLVNCA